MYVAAIAHLGMLPGIFISILRIFFTNFNTFPGKFWLWTSVVEKVVQRVHTFSNPTQVDVCIVPTHGPIGRALRRHLHIFDRCAVSQKKIIDRQTDRGETIHISMGKTNMCATFNDAGV